MAFFQALWAEALESSTEWLLLLAMVAFVLSKALAIDKPRFKAMFFFIAAHLVGLFLTAGFVAVGSSAAEISRTPTWILAAVGTVGAGATLLFSVVLPRMRLHAPLIVQDVVVGLSMVAASVAVLSRAGVNLSGLIATSAVFTAMLGFSLQDVIGNIAGGLALQVDNSIGIGDWIKVGDVNGRVIEIRWRHTAVETRNWETVLIPNTAMTKSNVIILGRRRGQPTQLRRWVWFNVDWRFQPGDVINVVQTAVRAAHIERVAREPAPQVVLMDMTDTFGKYAVRYFLTDIAVDDPTDSDVRACVYFALQRADMSLAMPAHALFVTEETHDRKQIKTERQLARRRELLERLELFGACSSEERNELAKSMKYSPFAKNEVMTRQGAEAHWLYLMEEGEAVVRVSDGVSDREVAQLKGPCIFGEMSLLTGEPRSATVIATTEVECFRLDKTAIQPLLAQRPALAEQLARGLTDRKTALQSAREGASADTAKERAARDANALLSRIKSFFDID
ncbi:MAG: mechanosensitive ion channel [Archangium sp.]|nr:mechanosensitive ion channel [Archangium sp.]